jgi:succinate-semialdehyde dehydrogenase/glutarate-semialdehyde dehydrogenase
MALVSINPATKTKFAEENELTDDQIKDKLSSAQSAYEGWRKLACAQRAGRMKKTARALRDGKKRLAKIATEEMGKTLRDAEAEVEKCALVCDYYAGNAEKFLKPEPFQTDASQSYARFDPLGIIFAVMPWNFPYWQVFRFAAPALMAGNVGVLKHASNVQQCAKEIENIFISAGLPKGVFQNLAIGSSKVSSVIKDPRVQAVTLTGSEYAGGQVAMQAGEEIKKTVLELGGSDPFIVLADADVSRAARTAVAARLQFNAGQSCISAKRFIIHESLADEFVQKAKASLNQLSVGDPANPKTDVGPLSSEQTLLDVEKQVKASVTQGAKIITGGKRGSSKGYFYLPTLLFNVDENMPVFSEEVFGPVMPVITFKEDLEAVKLANSNRYGLAAAIFSADTDKAENLAAKLEAGAVFINGQVKSDPRLPFGGVKKSGYGRELSHYGIKEFVNIKTIWVK